MQVLIFEDSAVNNFYPISQTRPLWEIRCGMFSMRERLEVLCKKEFGQQTKFHYFCREELSELYRKKYPELKIDENIPYDDDLLILNGRLLSINNINSLEKNKIYNRNGSFAASLIDKDTLKNITSLINIISKQDNSEINDLGLETIEDDSNFEIAEYIWQVVLENGEMIKNDFKLLDQKNNNFENYDVTFIGDKSQIYIEKDVKIDPLVVIDATKGPVIISSGVEINSFTRIEGPGFIGKNSLLISAKMREGCSIGEMCRVGGEVEDAIFHSFSNKYHDGFIGHAYIGEWVNLGALTTNSDLKNNYSNVKCYIPDEIIDTKSNKVGCFIGDYTKTSIGTLMNTGSSIGVGAMIVHSGRMTPPHTSDFTWFIKNQLRELPDWKDFIDSCKMMMSRRGQNFTDEHEQVLKNIFNNTSKIRDKEIKEWNKKLK